MRTDKESTNVLYISILPFISVLIILLVGYINNTDLINMLKIGIMVFLMTTALMFFVRVQDGIFKVRFSKSIIAISYLLSILLIMLQNNPETYSFWMVGGLLIAMLIDNRMGLMVYFIHSFIVIVVYSLKPEATIHLLIMGLLLILLSKALKNKSTVIYAAIILLSSNITLSFVMNNFIFETNRSYDYLASFFSVLAVLASAFLLSYMYDRFLVVNDAILEYAPCQTDIEQLSEGSSEGVIAEAILNEENMITSSDRNERVGYEILLSEDNELLLRIKKYSEALYKHSLSIGDLSARAARAIGANDELAQAGGYYHEVGKINGKDYIDEGLKLADEYAFPEELKAILRQHNIKHDKPTFVESAIVMISDNVASTIEYMRKSDDQRYSSDRIIDNIFKMRMEKGTFDEANLTVREFKLLKDFYQNEYKADADEDKS